MNNHKIGSDEWLKAIPARPYYRDESSVLFNADSYSLLPEIGQDYSLLLSDPPYGIDYYHSGGGGICNKNGVRLPTRFGDVKVAGDDKPFDPIPFLGLAKKTILWGGNHFSDKLPTTPGWLIWDKRCNTTTNDQSDCEMAWSDCSGTARIFYHMWNGMLKDSERGKQRVHSTQKPAALMSWCIQKIAKLKPGSTIIDPFMGSGPVAEAAKNNGCFYVGIEMVESYCCHASNRLQQEVLPMFEIIKNTETNLSI